MLSECVSFPARNVQGAALECRARDLLQRAVSVQEQVGLRELCAALDTIDLAPNTSVMCSSDAVLNIWHAILIPHAAFQSYSRKCTFRTVSPCKAGLYIRFLDSSKV